MKKTKSKVSFDVIVSTVMAFRGDNQTSLSERIGVTQGNFSNMLRGRFKKSSHFDYLEDYVEEGLKDICIFCCGDITEKQEMMIEKTVRDSFRSFLRTDNEK